MELWTSVRDVYEGGLTWPQTPPPNMGGCGVGQGTFGAPVEVVVIRLHYVFNDCS